MVKIDWEADAIPLRAGGVYLNRKGDRVGPMRGKEDGPNVIYPFSDGVHTYAPTGRYRCLDGTRSELDIIAEASVQLDTKEVKKGWVNVYRENGLLVKSNLHWSEVDAQRGVGDDAIRIAVPVTIVTTYTEGHGNC